jgi:hypothetical protein
VKLVSSTPSALVLASWQPLVAQLELISGCISFKKYTESELQLAEIVGILAAWSSGMECLQVIINNETENTRIRNETAFSLIMEGS